MSKLMTSSQVRTNLGDEPKNLSSLIEVDLNKKPDNAVPIEFVQELIVFKKNYTDNNVRCWRVK